MTLQPGVCPAGYRARQIPPQRGSHDRVATHVSLGPVSNEVTKGGKWFSSALVHQPLDCNVQMSLISTSVHMYKSITQEYFVFSLEQQPCIPLYDVSLSLPSIGKANTLVSLWVYLQLKCISMSTCNGYNTWRSTYTQYYHTA